VEHDPVWFERVRDEAQRRKVSNWTGVLAPPQAGRSPPNPDPADWNGYVSDDPYYRGGAFQTYAGHIDSFPDHAFDVVLIDGRARPSCLKHALPKVRPGGCLLWDNSERAYYASAMERIPAEFTRYDFPGPGPYVPTFWRTTIWVRALAEPRHKPEAS
jgi:hypothetical protein